LLQPATGRIGNFDSEHDSDAKVHELMNNTRWGGYRSAITDRELVSNRQLDPSTRRARSVHNYCGTDWTTANSQCTIPCPDGESTWCPDGQNCFADVTSCPGMVISSTAEGTTWSPETSINNADGGTETAGFGQVNMPISQQTATVSSVSAALPAHCPNTPQVSIGYYQSWARYRTCHPVSPSSIDAKGLTHVIYSFAGIQNGRLDAYNGVVDEYSAYAEFNKIRSQGVKTLIAVGGWTFDQSLFTQVASSAESRSIFAQSCVDFMRTHGFDGLDIDWEYPVSRQGTPQDYDNLVLLSRSLREAFGTQYLLTIAIPASVDKLSQGYDMSNLKLYMDWMHVMSYDIYGSWDENAGSNTDMGYISNTVEYLLNYMDSSQLVLGLASYGRSMALVDGECTIAGCPIKGGAITGCSGELGFIPYFELKESYIDTKMYESMLFNEATGSMEMVVPVDNGGKVWISLDVEQSWKVKQEFAMDK